MLKNKICFVQLVGTFDIDVRTRLTDFEINSSDNGNVHQAGEGEAECGVGGLCGVCGVCGVVGGKRLYLWKIIGRGRGRGCS